jgi:hypothetical protein
MEYLTLLDYLYVISAPERKHILDKAKDLASYTTSKFTGKGAFFLPNHLTLLNRLLTLKHHIPTH